MGPAVTITGDIVWDRSQGNPNGQNLQMKLTTFLSPNRTVHLPTEEQKKQAEIANAALSTMREQALAETSMAGNSELERIRRENLALKEQHAKIQQQMAKPSELTVKESQEVKEIEQSKEELAKKNLEVEKLLQQVMRDQSNPGEGILRQSPQLTESLIQLLIQLVLHRKQARSQGSPVKTAQADIPFNERENQSLQTLVELLKSDKSFHELLPGLQGSQGGFSTLLQQVPESDKS